MSFAIFLAFVALPAATAVVLSFLFFSWVGAVVVVGVTVLVDVMGVPSLATGMYAC